MAGKIEIRYVKADDLLPVLGMIEDLHAAEWSEFPLNRDKVARMMTTCLAAGIVILAYVDGEPAGVLALRPDSLWWSDHDVLIDVIFYVRPQHRRYPVWRTLLREAQQISDASGLPIYFVNSSSKETNRKDRLYGRYLEPAGRVYRHTPR